MVLKRKKRTSGKFNKDDFAALYDKYAVSIYRFIYLKINSVEDSQDMTSEVFFRFWRNVANSGRKKMALGKKRSKVDNPRALLYKIANNIVIDFYRKKPRADLLIDSKKDDKFSQIPDKTDIEAGMALSSDLEDIKKALNMLKGDQQNVLVWRYIDQLSYKEISQILDRPEGAVRVMAHRALIALKKKL